MKTLSLLAIGITAALLAAACDSGSSTGTLSNTKGGVTGDRATQGDDDDDDTTPADKAKDPTTTVPGGADTTTGTPPVVTNSPGGKAFYIASVHPSLATKCGGCHGTAGPGPNWLSSADAEKSYTQLFAQGYVITGSRITIKGAHGGVTTNVLSTDEIGKFNTWVGMETKDGGAKATPNVLAKLGTCFDKTKFDAMKMDTWVTTRRTQNNNTNNVTPWNENANNCTGCDNAQCSTCHSADPATNFINSAGNNVLPADNTFKLSQSTAPAYITKYFGISPDGKPVSSDGIKKKSDATKLAKAYSHPMFTLNTAQQTALDAFVSDVVTKYAAGTCGQ